MTPCLGIPLQREKKFLGKNLKIWVLCIILVFNNKIAIMSGKEHIRDNFNEYYNMVYSRWRINKEKAGKDIVGEEYESFRRRYYTSKGLEIGNRKNVLNSGVNTDLVIVKDGRVVIVEEDKGSYIDGTFLKRAVIDASLIFDNCIRNNIEVPYFILSCPTSMANYDKTFSKLITLFNDDIRKELNNKFLYMPLCKHGRVDRKNYFKSVSNHFELCDTLLESQENLIDRIIG